MTKKIQEKNPPKIHHGRAVRHYRTLMDYTQEGLAAYLGCSQQNINNLEDREVIDEPTLQKCADFLKIDIGYLKKTFIDKNGYTIFVYGEHAIGVVEKQIVETSMKSMDSNMKTTVTEIQTAYGNSLVEIKNTHTDALDRIEATYKNTIDKLEENHNKMIADKDKTIVRLEEQNNTMVSQIVKLTDKVTEK